MSHLLLDEKPIAILPSLARAIGLNEAIALQQLHYWLNGADESGKFGRTLNGRTWIYNDYQEWKTKNFPFWSISTIRRTFSSLEKRGLVISEMEVDSTLPGGKRKWYTINYAKVAHIGCVQNEHTPLSNLNTPSAQNEHTPLSILNTPSAQNEQAIYKESEITSEITTETTTETTDSPPSCDSITPPRDACDPLQADDGDDGPDDPDSGDDWSLIQQHADFPNWFDSLWAATRSTVRGMDAETALAWCFETASAATPGAALTARLDRRESPTPASIKRARDFIHRQHGLTAMLAETQARISPDSEPAPPIPPPIVPAHDPSIDQCPEGSKFTWRELWPSVKDSLMVMFNTTTAEYVKLATLWKVDGDCVWLTVPSVMVQHELTKRQSAIAFEFRKIVGRDVTLLIVCETQPVARAI